MLGPDGGRSEVVPHRRDTRRQPQCGRRSSASATRQRPNITTHGKQRLRRCRGCRSRSMHMSKQPMLECEAEADSPQGDLGHTDLQEDLEFHSSSTLSLLLALPCTLILYLRLRHAAHARCSKDPARLVLVPPRSHHIRLLLRPQALPVDTLLLCASLRCRYQRSPAPLHKRHIPARQFPRRSRGESRSVWARVDCHNGRGHLISDGHHQPISESAWRWEI